MATMVGTEDNYRELIENFSLLEVDALAAYEAAIQRLHDPDLADKVESFHLDHERRLTELRSMAAKAKAEAPRQAGAKKILTAGKVKIAAMLDGDPTILKAMILNERDLLSAYQNAVDNRWVPARAKGFFEGCLEDDRRHLEWMEQTAQSGDYGEAIPKGA